MFSSLHLVKNKKMCFFLHFFLPYLIDIFSDLPTTQTNKDYDPLFFNKLAMTNWAPNIHYNPVSLLKARFGGGGGGLKELNILDLSAKYIFLNL